MIDAKGLVVTLGVVAALGCATNTNSPPGPPPVQSQPPPAAVTTVAVTDPCAERSLDDAVHEARAALDAGIHQHAEQLGLAIEQALACEVRARRWQLELEAVELLAALDPLPEPQFERCRLSSDGWCLYTESQKSKPKKSKSQPAPVYDPLSSARLEAYARYEAAAAPGEALRSIRDRHIRVRLHQQDFVGALPLLQNYVVDYHEHPDAVRAAILLVDTQVMTWRERDEVLVYRGTSALAWFARLETLALWQHPAAVQLRARIVEVRPAAMWRAALEARDEGRAEWTARAAAKLPRSYGAAGFRRCAELFVQIYDDYPNHDRRDTLLWNAADCYDANYDFGEAHAIRTQLLSRYPESEHYRYTLLYIAQQEHSIARYDEAEDHYLEYALRYPKDYESRDVLQYAYAFGVALGHDTSKIVAEYVAREVKRDIERAGHFVWQTRPREPRRLHEFASEFLRDFGTKPGIPSFAAHQVVAELDWANACGGRLDDGLCVERQAAARNDQCPLGGVPLPDFRARKRKQGEDARARIRANAKRWKSGKRSIPIEYEVWAAELEAASAFLLLEPELEDYLLAGPDAPDARERAKQLDARYLEVVALGQIDFAIQAHARRGLIWERLASPDLRLHDGVCLPATAWAHGDRKRALAGYADCLALATEHQHFNDAARRCEATLAAAEPQRVPPLLELFGEPGLTWVERDTTGVVGEWP